MKEYKEYAVSKKRQVATKARQVATKIATSTDKVRQVVIRRRLRASMLLNGSGQTAAGRDTPAVLL